MSNYLPTDLVLEILVKLPVKSLVRFLTVSKSWRSIITTPAFIASQLSNAKNRTLLTYETEHNPLVKFTEVGPFCINSSSKHEFPFLSFLIKVGCCDGLVCLSDDVFGDPSGSHIIIWNPSVRNHTVLPKPTINPNESHIAVLGFGGVANHVYKVVRLVYCMINNGVVNFGGRPQVEIFSLETWSWRKVKTRVDFTLRAFSGFRRQAFLNGVVHWLSVEEPADDDNTTRRNSILAFDIRDEVFSEVNLPDKLASAIKPELRIFVIGGLFGAVNYDGCESCEVWAMKEYCVKESWTKLYNVPLRFWVEKIVAFSNRGEALLSIRRRVKSYIVANNPDTRYVKNYIVAYDPDTRRVKNYILANNHDTRVKNYIMAYDPDTRRSKDIEIDGTKELFYIDNYVESLLLLREFSGSNNGVVSKYR
ncbi:PREDICTED: F-box protein At3g07870-like [Erythranthe guttata]|uniref:F-box protein At3g07870-like n=1 Tax=Erythranthe guttata TaxID=4155 RepID=UPI00064DB2C2|nr:PREDICTED: F-box protein At3g07870-like [Erythranthe guttata]|eukprot:XP_012852423.1 PREDICTED: F-box protein At3g07870-like [Erythranthe guttata]